MPRISILAGLFLASSTLAQTWQPLATPEGGSLSRYVQVGDTLIASASMTTYRSTNAGASWSAISALPPMITMNSAVAVGDSIVGYFPGAGIYNSHDEGITWNHVADATTTEQFSNLVGIGTTVFARTGAGEIFRSSDLGATWTPIKRPNDTFALQLGTDATHLTISEFTGLYTSGDLGETWEPAFVLPQSSMIELYPTGATSQFAFIRDFINATTGLYRSTDHGVTWTLINNMPPSVQEVDSIRTYEGGLIALARFGSGPYVPLTSTDDGLSWTQIPTPPNDFYSSIGTFDSTIFLSGQQGAVRSSNLGANWTPSSAGTFSIAVGSVVSSGHAGYCNTNGRTTLLRSTNALDWSTRFTFPNFVGFIHATPGATPDQDEIFVGAQSSGLFRSTDGGATFSPINNGIPDYPLNDGAIRTVLDLVRVNETTLILALQGSSRPGRHGVGGSTYGAEGFIRSTNNGASWSQSNAGFPTIGINEVFQANWDQISHLVSLPNGTVVAATRSLGLYRSTNAGASWQQANTGVPTCGGTRPTFGDLIVLGNDIYASIESMGSSCPTMPGQILKSTDGGATWAFSNNGMPAESRTGRMSIIDGTLNVILRTTLGSFGVIYQSSDAGASWNEAASSPATPLTAPQDIEGTQVAGTVFTGLWALVPPPQCPGDTNTDGIVDGADLSVLLSQFGTSIKPGSGADFNNDGQVNSADLSVLLANFGTVGC